MSEFTEADMEQALRKTGEMVEENERLKRQLGEAERRNSDLRTAVQDLRGHLKVLHNGRTKGCTGCQWLVDTAHLVGEDEEK